MKVKKLISFVLVFVLALTCTFALSGCNSNNKNLQIDSYRLEKDGDDDVIIIKFHFKNDTGYETCINDEYMVSLYQNDIALDEYSGGYYADYEDWQEAQDSPSFVYDEDDCYKYVRDGGEYYPEMAFYLEDNEADVEVVIESYSLFSKETTKIIKIK